MRGEGPDGGLIGRHLREAHERFRGERQLADYLAQLARRLGDPVSDLQVTTEVARGDPAQVIIARTQARPSILALATHGRAGFDALWSASVGSRVIARGDGPFLLVHPEPAAAEPIGSQ